VLANAIWKAPFNVITASVVTSYEIKISISRVAAPFDVELVRRKLSASLSDEEFHAKVENLSHIVRDLSWPAYSAVAIRVHEAHLPLRHFHVRERRLADRGSHQIELEEMSFLQKSIMFLIRVKIA